MYVQTARKRRTARVEWELIACRRSSSKRERCAARSGWDSKTWGVLGSWKKGPSRDWVRWHLDGWGTVRLSHTEGKWGKGIPCHHHLFFFLGMYLCISAFCLDKEGCWRISVLCTHIHESLYISHLFDVIYFLVKQKSHIQYCICLTLSLADTHKSYCCQYTGKKWSITQAHTYEDTQTNKNQDRGQR